MDRNINCNSNFTQKKQSLSARRAWIEITSVREVFANFEVALRKESVDRNDAMQIVVVIVHAVALRKESVDRNCTVCKVCLCQTLSLSARRAWIEIGTYSADGPGPQSLSARRAWIEIGLNFARKIRYVSLSARRAWIEIILPPVDTSSVKRRSPQGERG